MVRGDFLGALLGSSGDDHSCRCRTNLGPNVQLQHVRWMLPPAAAIIAYLLLVQAERGRRSHRLLIRQASDNAHSGAPIARCQLCSAAIAQHVSPVCSRLKWRGSAAGCGSCRQSGHRDRRVVQGVIRHPTHARSLRAAGERTTTSPIALPYATNCIETAALMQLTTPTGCVCCPCPARHMWAHRLIWGRPPGQPLNPSEQAARPVLVSRPPAAWPRQALM